MSQKKPNLWKGDVLKNSHMAETVDRVFGIGLGVFTFFSSGDRYGGWWGVLGVFITGILALYSSNRNIVFTTCVMAILSLLVLTAAFIMDAVGYFFVNQYTGCYNTSTGKGSGSKDCVSSNPVPEDSPQCLCASDYDTTACYAYTLTSGDD
eukprot:gene29476-36538_t